MFQNLRHIDTAFRLVRGFCLLTMLTSMGVCLYAVYRTTRVVRESSEKMYILADGKVLQATAGSREENIPVEARDHIRTFHQYFFTLDPDDKVIQDHVDKSLYLADASAKKAYDDLKESGYYANLISGNMSQSVSEDSIRVSTGSYPFYWRYYGRETITRATSMVTRSLVTEGYLREVIRSDNNPHGFLIERWKIIENKDIKTESR